MFAKLCPNLLCLNLPHLFSVSNLEHMLYYQENRKRTVIIP